MEEIVVGIDTGGTFTDFIYKKGKSWRVFKLPSTPQNPAEAIIKGLKKIGGEKRKITHGTTVATNTLLERKGARVAFITNKGFKDILHIGRQNRLKLYSFKVEKPKPLVERELLFELSCRVNSKGEVVEEVKEEELLNLVKLLREKKAESVAVSFLFSFFNPSCEEKVKEFLEKEGFLVSISSQVVNEIREYERSSTTVVNAYVMPKMKAYLENIKSSLKEGDTLKIMQSNGGVISLETAVKQPVRTVLSGPAGGVMGAWSVAKTAGFKKVITFDMGGTSTDVSLVDGRPQITTSWEISGIPITVPMVKVHTVGAGGGSIAWIDRGGALRVGPLSAGAEPGPVCYGKGGREITITDANLFLGRLDEEFFLGGKMKLRKDLITEPLKELSKKLGVSPLEVADAVIKIANAKMEKAIRVISLEKGYSLKEFTLVSFGGAGGLHSAYLAKALNIPKVLIPKDPGILSAFGMVMSDVVKDYSRSVMLSEKEATYSKLKEVIDSLAELAVKELKLEGFSEDELLLFPTLDVRFKGQSFELSVPFCKEFKEKFVELHKELYGYAHEREIEVVNCRLRAVGKTEKPEIEELKEVPSGLPESALLKTKKVFFEEEWLETPVVSREKLFPGVKFKGPALIVEYSSTILLPPWGELCVDKFNNLLIEVRNG